MGKSISADTDMMTFYIGQYRYKENKRIFNNMHERGIDYDRLWLSPLQITNDVHEECGEKVSQL